MKTYTDVLINTFTGGHKWYKADPAMPQKQYEARHKKDDIYLMWMETKLLNKRCTLPCVLCEDGEALVFKSSEKFSQGDVNAMLMKRWCLFVTPDNIHTDYDVTELSDAEFKEKFKLAQSGQLFLEEESEESEDECANEEESVPDACEEKEAMPV